jgi:hypothetical protein|tara:strand:+ start:72 stop:329 length:258 start_codon:yes stop_codon:yes gene_type:complete
MSNVGHGTARQIIDSDGDAVDDASGHLKTITSNSLVPAEYDYISLAYSGDNLTGVTYKTGGSGGTTVATLTLAYSGSTLTSVTKT